MLNVIDVDLLYTWLFKKHQSLRNTFQRHYICAASRKGDMRSIIHLVVIRFDSWLYRITIQMFRIGCAEVGTAYYNGRGVERDERKADHYYERAAMRGHAAARHNLGNAEGCAGNWDRALKHWMISAGRGQNESVKMIQQLYMDGDATKEDYSKALQAYQKYLDDIKSEQRDKAAAFSDVYKYY